jgi:hypothetical protein
MLKPETAVDTDEVTPPEKVAVWVSGTFRMTTPEPPAAPEVDGFPPPPPPLPVFIVPETAATVELG